MTKQQIKRRIEDAIAKLAKVRAAATSGLVPSSLKEGKLYEAHVLAVILGKMVTTERLSVTLKYGKTKKGARIALRSKGGKIADAFPHFELSKGGNVVAEVWTDIEFLSLSYFKEGKGRALTPGDYHELDIVVVTPGTRGYPNPEQILLGVECKNTNYGKDMLRQILGVRRELSLLHSPLPTFFGKWPQVSVRAKPPSCLVVFCTDVNAKNFEAPGKMFGIEFIHETI